MQAIKQITRSIDARDVIALSGLGLTASGLAMVYVPAALIVPGASLSLFAVWSANRSTRHPGG